MIAAGTTVVRALEACAAAHGPALAAGEAETDLVLGPGFAPRVVDGLLTGMHPGAPATSSCCRRFAARDCSSARSSTPSARATWSTSSATRCLILEAR